MADSGLMYQYIEIWIRVDKSNSRRYRCFRNMSNSRYSVQSLDFVRLPMDPDELVYLERQFYELFIEQAPDSRASSYPTIEEAIEAHDIEFGVHEESSR